MEEKKEFKVQGLRFARSLQMLLKMVNMFSADHKSASGLLQRSYDILNPLVKQSRNLTLGFVDQRVLLNNILTAEDTLKPLENEFLKRGIGAVTFEAGITVAAYRNAIAAISANAKLIDEHGGLLPFLEQRQLKFVRVFPAAKTDTRNEDGDTVLEMGSEEYLISKALNSMNSGLPQGIEALLAKMETAGTVAASGQPAGGFEQGAGNAAARNENSGGAAGDFTGKVAVYNGAGTVGNTTGSYLTEMQRMVEQKFEASLRNPEEDPQKAYVELARMLGNVRPGLVASTLAGGTAAPESSQEEVTAEVFEDTALRWALRRLAATPSGEEAIIVEEQVFRVLMRSLQATHSAARLAQKLAQFAQEYALPGPTYERIQEEIRWITFTPKQKLRELLAISHFTPAQFRRCLELIKDLVRLGKPEDAVALGFQYFSIFEDFSTLQMNEIGRIPELLNSLAGAPGEFWEFAAARLIEALASGKLNQLVHLQVVNSLVALARTAATYEDFSLVLKIGTALEESAGQNQATHTVCCNASISNLLQPSAVDRIAEIFLDKKNEPVWTRTVAGILRWAGAGAVERLFVALDQEQVAANRLALMRLLGKIGPGGLAAARQRLQHREWYVVRNACKLLGELKDPELLKYVAPVLEHQDERVRKAAFQAVMESKLPGRATVIANALPLLSPRLREDALCELMHHADAESLPGLEAYFNASAEKDSKSRLLIIKIMAAIPQEQAVHSLSRISYSGNIDPRLHNAVQEALSARASRKSSRFLEPESNGSDPARRWVTQGRTS
ncbi:MAG TPA: HEAT repeat domain-containing protein [Candidatus Angelobacter sp.]|jgi:HEAT repeat protein